MKVQLKEIRTARKISQNELARLLGMSLANIQKIEYGKAKSIPLDTLDKLCKVLKCNPGDLLQFFPDHDDGQDILVQEGRTNEVEQSGKLTQDNPSHHEQRDCSVLMIVPQILESA